MNKKGKAFTLIELLAMIVILAIIMVIAIPQILGAIDNAKKSAFKEDAERIIGSLNIKTSLNHAYNLKNLTSNNIDDELGISNNNYESLSVSFINDVPYIEIIGKNTWEGIAVYGTKSNMTILPVPKDSCFTFDSGTGTITDYNVVGSEDCPDAFAIPSRINGVTVTTIGPAAFTFHLTKFIIPDTVTSIGNMAFELCDATSVNIPNSVTSIGNQAFYECLLQTVSMPDTLTSLGASAFTANYLTSIDIPTGLTTISSGVFSSNNITSVTLPSGITSIGENAFSLNSLTNIVIPDNVTSIGANAFSSNNLTSITIPNSVTSIGNGALSGNNLSSITIKRTGTTIGSNLLAWSNNNFRTSYTAGGAGTYTGTQTGTWTKQ